MTFKDQLEKMQEIQSQHPDINVGGLIMYDDNGNLIKSVYYDQQDSSIRVSAFDENDRM